MEERILGIVSKGGSAAVVLVIAISMFFWLYIKVVDVENSVASTNIVVESHSTMISEMKARHVETEAMLQEIRANVAFIKGKIEKE